MRIRVLTRARFVGAGGSGSAAATICVSFNGQSEAASHHKFFLSQGACYSDY